MEIYQNLWDQQKRYKREVDNNKCLQKATRKVSNFAPQGTRKRR